MNFQIFVVDFSIISIHLTPLSLHIFKFFLQYRWYNHISAAAEAYIKRTKNAHDISTPVDDSLNTSNTSKDPIDSDCNNSTATNTTLDNAPNQSIDRRDSQIDVTRHANDADGETNDSKSQLTH